VPAVARHHSGQDRARAVNDALDVGVDHRLPIVEIGLGRGLEAEREPGIVDEDVGVGEGAGQGRDRGLDRRALAHVEMQRMKIRAEFLRQHREAIVAPPGADDLHPGLDVAPRQGGAESGRGAGDENAGGLLIGHRILLARGGVAAAGWPHYHPRLPSNGDAGAKRQWRNLRSWAWVSWASRWRAILSRPATR
jgi:hypothetical protein